MKHTLLMTGTKAVVQSYLAWSQRDRDAHMAVPACRPSVRS